MGRSILVVRLGNRYSFRENLSTEDLGLNFKSWEPKLLFDLKIKLYLVAHSTDESHLHGPSHKLTGYSVFFHHHEHLDVYAQW